MKCLLTGSRGFVGRAVYPYLRSKGHEVSCAVRRLDGSENSPDGVAIGSIDATTDWGDALLGVDVVVHLAGRAHVLDERSLDSLTEFRNVNVGGTINLAQQAARRRVRRFVFISSIGVNGIETEVPFTAADRPAPREPYAVSKLEAEEELFKLGKNTGMEIVVIRPPLVYGSGAPGNFGRLVQAVKKGVPLPFGSVRNRRTLIGIDNLVDLIACCVEHPAAANQVFLGGDADDISTTKLLRLIGEALGKPARLLPIPVAYMEMMAEVFGRGATVKKICGDLQVDITKSRDLLGWVPPVSVVEGLKRVSF